MGGVMKVTLDIPDWVFKERRAIHVMAGIERVAYKLPWEDFWNVKISRCSSSCGECCKKLDCDKLVEYGDGFKCKEDEGRPFQCCVSEPKKIYKCTSKYKRV